MKNIAVLGRGKSLKRYKKFSSLFDKIYICGRFHKEIKKIGENHFKDKEIIHVAARTSSPLRNNYYNKLNVKHVQTACHSIEKEFCTSNGKQLKNKYPKDIKLEVVPECMKKRGYPPLSCDIIENFCNKFDNYKKLCIFLEKKMIDKIKESGKDSRRTRYWPTTGVFAVDLALSENNIDKIYLFGVDLYTTITLVIYKTICDEFLTPIETQRTRLAFYHITQLVKEFPFVEFYSVSISKKFDFGFENWNLI